MYNKVMLIGRLGKDPEVRHLEGGSTLAKFSLATNKNYKDQSGNWKEITEWHNVVAWGRLAERLDDGKIKKGILVFVEAELTTSSYQDQEGNDRRRTEVKIYLIRNLERTGNGQDGGRRRPSEPPTDFPEEDTAPQADEADDFEQEEDDLPF